MKYPETILQDSSYESDSKVRNQDPLKYIIGNDIQKKERLERGGSPKRILGARNQGSDFK